MTNATVNSKRRANLIPHCNAQPGRLHLRRVRSWAINLCSWAGHHTCSLSGSFPRKQLCVPLEWWGNAPSTLCPNSRATPSRHQWPPFWGNSEKVEMGGHSKAHTKTSHTSPAGGALSPSPVMGPSPAPLAYTPVTPHSQRKWLKEEELYENTPFQPGLKSQHWCGLTAKQHIPAPPLSCHLLTSKGSHQHAQACFQCSKNLENQTTTTSSSYLSSDFVTCKRQAKF